MLPFAQPSSISLPFAESPGFFADDFGLQELGVNYTQEQLDQIKHADDFGLRFFGAVS